MIQSLTIPVLISSRSVWPKHGRRYFAMSFGAVYRVVEGRLKRSKKVLAVRGLNINHNHDLKNIFKGAATRGAGAVPGPFQEFHAGLVARGMKPTMARLTPGAQDRGHYFDTLEEKVGFDAEHLKQQAA